jgi:hypothetical protein
MNSLFFRSAKLRYVWHVILWSRNTGTKVVGAGESFVHQRTRIQKRQPTPNMTCRSPSHTESTRSRRVNPQLEHHFSASEDLRSNPASKMVRCIKPVTCSLIPQIPRTSSGLVANRFHFQLLSNLSASRLSRRATSGGYASNNVVW